MHPVHTFLPYIPKIHSVIPLQNSVRKCGLKCMRKKDSHSRFQCAKFPTPWAPYTPYQLVNNNNNNNNNNHNNNNNNNGNPKIQTVLEQRSKNGCKSFSKQTRYPTV
jgi:hypothetical protein